MYFSVVHYAAITKEGDARGSQRRKHYESCVQGSVSKAARNNARGNLLRSIFAMFEMIGSAPNTYTHRGHLQLLPVQLARFASIRKSILTVFAKSKCIPKFRSHAIPERQIIFNYSLIYLIVPVKRSDGSFRLHGIFTFQRIKCSRNNDQGRLLEDGLIVSFLFPLADPSNFFHAVFSPATATERVAFRRNISSSW